MRDATHVGKYVPNEEHMECNQGRFYLMDGGATMFQNVAL